jgi:hypothetical protein
LWKFPAFLNPCEFSSLEMVLVDEKVHDIYNYVSYIWLYFIYGYTFIYRCILYIMIC